MNRYIAFLRGINVSGQKQIKMADLRVSLEEADFRNVRTYIQSGNVILDSLEKSEVVTQGIEKVILEDFGFHVPVLVTTTANIRTILKNYPFSDAEEKNQNFVLLHDKPKKASVDEFNMLQFRSEDYLITDNCVYLNCKNGAGKAKLTNNLVERKLKVVATTRNLRTMEKITELAH